MNEIFRKYIVAQFVHIRKAIPRCSGALTEKRIGTETFTM